MRASSIGFGAVAARRGPRSRAAGARRPATITLREPASPFVAFNVWIHSGSPSDPNGKEGLASLTAGLLARAPPRRTATSASSQKQYPLAAGYAVSVDKEMTNLHRPRAPRQPRGVLRPVQERGARRRRSPRPTSPGSRRSVSNYLERGRRYARDEELEQAAAVLDALTPARRTSTRKRATWIRCGRSRSTTSARFYRTHYRRGNVTAALGGGYPDGFAERVRQDVAALPEGSAPAVVGTGAAAGVGRQGPARGEGDRRVGDLARLPDCAPGAATPTSCRS